jgi:hypothetical protein
MDITHEHSDFGAQIPFLGPEGWALILYFFFHP